VQTSATTNSWMPITTKTEQKIVNENGRDNEMLKHFHLTFQQTKGASTDLLLRVEVEQPGRIWPRPGV
jgi:hypothetical protein